MSASIDFGEHEAFLPCDRVNAALTFSRELFSREYVVQRVTRQELAVAIKQNENQWRGIARIHTGHVVVSVDDVAVRGLSSRQFAELWYPPAPQNPNELSRTHRRVRFRDRKRAELEVEMQKQWTSSGPMRFSPVEDEVELQAKIREVHALIWAHQLTEAHVTLRSLPVGSDQKVCLLAAELEVVRVLVSKDVLYLKQAQRVATQAVTWLESMHELSSQSYSSRKQTQVALAEALFLSALLRLGRDQRLAAINTARRCAAIYVELRDKFLISNSKREKLLMPERELQAFQKRIRFGLGILHVGGALALKKTSLEWIGVLLKGSCDIKKGIEHLLDCCTIMEDSQANWAALTLMHCSGALRLIQQRNKQGVELLNTAISACKQAALQRHPKALVFLWSQATTTSFDGDKMQHLEIELTRVVKDEERVHLAAFDVGYRHFLARDFDRASVHFMPICKCSSAPFKLRGLSSLFLAVGYLLTSHDTSELVVLDTKLLTSVRLLLRSARRFLGLRLEDIADDYESASLHERLGDYLERSDEYLLLLPWEILYVYYHSTKTVIVSLKSDVVQRHHHEAALKHLSDLSTSKQDHDAELTLLRAIVLFNLREFDDSDIELHKLWSERFTLGSPRSSALGRLLNQKSSGSPAFIAPVAWFYQLRLLLERRYSKLTSITTDPGVSSPKYSKTESAPTFAGAVQQSPYPYHYVYNGKLHAMNKLVTRLANDKINDKCNSPRAWTTTKS
ncbi:hypothetical protein GN244_ATG10298 [Phytophthora infestans]|uniref:Uncharacterized protein n=1 Tax=Phytophthora infestans TaxID=4787 RepID=A0A833W0Z6_PHYIN|nr:hypothetical protein GN244_ATG10298 [Phytophthora infestans]KAF4139811.1 hypothetical protein GN958_ATG11052 [Phytophthora infestans]